jgi:hypothetical protein
MIIPSSAPMIPISWGELIDKITILEIKKINLVSANALVNVNKELSYLNVIFLGNDDAVNKVMDLKNQLFAINLRLWKVEDDIRNKDLIQEFDAKFIQLARNVYRLNDERAKLKKLINQVLDSELVEEKSYRDFQSS